MDCEVTELTPPRRLAYTWASDKVDTREDAQQEAAFGTQAVFKDLYGNTFALVQR